MSWSPREAAASTNSIATFDAQALIATTYSATATLGCNDEMVTSLTAIEGAGAFVQGASSTSTSGGATSIAQVFGGSNTGGNCIVVDVAFQPTTILPTLLSCADTLGNTYTQIFSHKIGGGLCQTAQFIAFGIAAGANTVTVSSVSDPPFFTGVLGEPCIAIHEYQSGTSVDTYDVVQQVSNGTVNPAVTTSQSNELLHLFSGIVTACAGSPVVAGPSGGPTIPGAWLVINEPSLGFTDRTNYLYRGEKNDHAWSMELRQRGQATVPLWIPAGDTYAPTRGTPIYLFDQTLLGGYTLDFAGLIQDIQYKWSGTAGNRICTFTAVSLESVFDTVYADGTDQFIDQTCGAIFTALFNKYEHGCPVSLGTISAGVTVPLYCPQKGQKLSDQFNQLATTSQFTWGVNPQTLQLYFAEPSVIPAPFTIGNANVLWDSFTWKINGSDYRNRQGIKLSDTAFPQSGEFFAGSGQQSLTLMRPVKQVVSAYVTIASPNFATGTFSGQPSAGDTITIGPQNKPWSHGTYLLGTVIVSGGFVFQVTFAGTSGSSLPVFDTVTGATTADGSVIWTCLGAYGVGAGELASSTYTFVASLDNTQAFQILIGTTLAATVQNTVDAINSAAPYGGPPATNGKGVTFSLPTWEGAQVNATVVSGTEIKVTNKQAAIVGVSSLATTSSAFSWSGTQTSGGSFPQGSVGPNEPGTISIAVYPLGTSTAAPGLAYQEGSAVVSLATPLNSGTNLNVWYTRADGGSIEVENTALVTALAAITHGTGKYQQFTDQSSQGLISTSAFAGLQLVQQILEAYSVTPTSFDFKTYSPGLFPGMSLVVSLTLPTGGTAILNGTWVIESVEAELIPAKPYFGKWGHYRYTIKCVDIQEIASYLDFWEGLASGSSASSGVGGGGPLVATSGASVSTQGNYGPKIEVNGTAAGSQTVLNLTAGSHITVTDDGLGDITIAGTTPLTTKGDVYVFGTSPTRLPVGTDGQVLTARSSATDGVDWETGTLGTVTHTTGSLTSGLPVFGNGGADIKVQTPRGNTTVVQLADSTTNPTTGNAAMFDANGNVKDAGVSPAQTATSVSHKFVTSYNGATGVFTLAQPADADISFTNITTGNVNTSNHGFAPISPGSATVYLDGTGAYSTPPGTAPTATTSTLGLVKPDGATIDISAGVISVPTATTSALGLVKPDGSSITISGGVISSSGGAVSSLTTTGSSGAATLSGGVLNIPVYSGGGGGGFSPYSSTALGTAITTSNWTTIGSGGTRTNLTGAINIVGNTGGSINTNIYGVSTTIAAGNFTKYLALWIQNAGSTYGNIGVGFTDGTKFSAINVQQDNTGGGFGLQFVCGQASAYSGAGYVAITGAAPNYNGGLPYQLLLVQLNRTGTSNTASISFDGGFTWTQIFSDTAPYLTASSLLVFSDPRGSSTPTKFTLISYQ